MPNTLIPIHGRENASTFCAATITPARSATSTAANCMCIIKPTKDMVLSVYKTLLLCVRIVTHKFIHKIVAPGKALRPGSRSEGMAYPWSVRVQGRGFVSMSLITTQKPCNAWQPERRLFDILFFGWSSEAAGQVTPFFLSAVASLVTPERVPRNWEAVFDNRWLSVVEATGWGKRRFESCPVRKWRHSSLLLYSSRNVSGGSRRPLFIHFNFNVMLIAIFLASAWIVFRFLSLCRERKEALKSVNEMIYFENTLREWTTIHALVFVSLKLCCSK